MISITQQPELFGVKFSLKEYPRIFSIKLHHFKLWKMPKILNFRFLKEGYFFLIVTILNQKDLK